VHDLRIKIGEGDIWARTLRTPTKGELRANVAQGGTERHLFPYVIPESAILFAQEIDKYFSGYPRYYSIDLANTEQGWKLIELNSKPGLSPVSMSKQSKHTTNQLAKYLVKLASQQKLMRQQADEQIS
jgi:glutathione synthase/RimK-type ligase-like ATP-grasp enzyme